MMEKVLVIGSGARESAIARSLRTSGFAKSIVIVPGNGSSESQAIQPASNSVLDFLRYALQSIPDLTIVGPDNPLAEGVVDLFRQYSLPIVGPTMEAAQLESSKIFAKRAMKRWGVPTADFKVFASSDTALDFLMRQPEEKAWVIKADGLCLGKGVTVAARRREAISAVGNIEAKYGQRLVIEEKLDGVECSYTVFVRGNGLVIAIPTAADYKRLKVGDDEPMTGGMGCYAPHPDVGEEVEASIISGILMPTLEGLAREKIRYQGFLYLGLMLTRQGPKLLEYNVRLGDPEATVILPLLGEDFWETALTSKGKNKLAAAVYGGGLIFGSSSTLVSGMTAVSVVIASKYYPSSRHSPTPIFGIKEAEETGAVVLHAATKMVDGQLMTDGGRVLTIVGTGTTYLEARAKAYAGVSKIHFDGMQYRDDIAEGL